jgi:uncharacterized protein YaeQ
MSAPIHRFEIHLADTDRAHYEELELRLARHPSETERYLITRALAFCILHEEELQMTAGICQGDEPAMELRDSTGLRTHWVDVGRPSAAHVQRGLRDCRRVTLVTTRSPPEVLRVLEAADVRLLDRLEIIGLAEPLVQELAERLDRRNSWSVTVSGGRLYVEAGSSVVEGDLDRLLGAEP